VTVSRLRMHLLLKVLVIYRCRPNAYGYPPVERASRRRS